MNQKVMVMTAVALAISALGAYAVMSAQVLNGSFEADPRNPFPSAVTNWTLGGFRYVGVENMTSYYGTTPPDETRILTYNNGQRPSGSSISQDLTTEIGKTYDLKFYFGNFGYGISTQIMNVSVDDVANNQNLISQVFVDSTASDPRYDPLALTLWNDVTVRFQASSAVTRIRLSDNGSSTNATDLLLDRVRIEEVDTAPPIIEAAADKTTLWPPNGKNHTVTITGSTDDTGSGVASVTWALSDSYGEMSGGGSLPSGGSFSLPVELLASRRGNDPNGRVYTITITATDGEGNVGTRTVQVTVPHDQGH
ncbi:hypothetical protein [Armatimonas sp.]|uniref:hypothetical protein n=1 Tax=Armatimonas sp. TaxID=1872638 RepID=UPI0037512157